MNRRGRKNGRSPRRLAALVLCCVCLLGTVSAAAPDRDAVSTAEEMQGEIVEPTETTCPVETEAPAETDPTETTQTTEATEPEPTEDAQPEITEPAAPAESAPTEPTDSTDAAQSPSSDLPETDTEPIEEAEEAREQEPEEQEPEEAAKTEPEEEENPVERLFRRIMDCTTYEELEALLDSLTEEELLLLEQFSEEQSIAVQAKIEALSGSLAQTLAARPLTIAQGETKSVTVAGISEYGFQYSCDQSGITAARVSGGYRISVSDSVPAGTYTLQVSYYVLGGSWSKITDTITLTVTQAVEAAQVYYLKTPASSPDSNDTSQWGRNIGTGTVSTGGAVWTDNKNIFSPGQYVLSMPAGMVPQGDGSWLLPKSGTYAQDYTAIYTAYKTQLEKDLGVTLSGESDIEAIYLIPYKISKNNGTSPDKHIDCKISVKTSQFFTALFWVTMPDGTIRQVDAKNCKMGDTVARTAMAPGADYPETMEVEGVPYRFTGWYNEESRLVGEEEWAYAPNDAELADGTVNFYAKYIPSAAKLSIKKTLSGNMYSPGDTFVFTVRCDDTQTQYTLGKDQTAELLVPIGAEVTVTEASGGYSYSLSSLLPENLEYTALDCGISFVMPGEDVSLVINNEKNVTVDTGVLPDGGPYLWMLAFAGLGAVLLWNRRRTNP